MFRKQAVFGRSALIPEQPRQTPAERVGIRPRYSPAREPERRIASRPSRSGPLRIAGMSLAVLLLAAGLALATGITGTGGLPLLGGGDSASSAAHGSHPLGSPSHRRPSAA